VRAAVAAAAAAVAWPEVSKTHQSFLLTTERCGRVNKSRDGARLSRLQGSPGVNLRRLYGLHPDLARGPSQMFRRAGLLVRQHQPPLLFQKLSLILAQRLALVTVLNRREVLPGRVNETARKHKPTREQQRQPREGARVALAVNGKILSIRR
jgi:hypothetical protein